MLLPITGAWADEKKPPEGPPPGHYDNWPERYYDEHGYLEYNPKTNTYEYHRFPEQQKKKSPRRGSGQTAPKS